MRIFKSFDFCHIINESKATFVCDSRWAPEMKNISSIQNNRFYFQRNEITGRSHAGNAFNSNSTGERNIGKAEGKGRTHQSQSTEIRTKSHCCEISSRRCWNVFFLISFRTNDIFWPWAPFEDIDSIFEIAHSFLPFSRSIQWEVLVRRVGWKNRFWSKAKWVIHRWIVFTQKSQSNRVCHKKITTRFKHFLWKWKWHSRKCINWRTASSKYAKKNFVFFYFTFSFLIASFSFCHIIFHFRKLHNVSNPWFFDFHHFVSVQIFTELSICSWDFEQREKIAEIKSMRVGRSIWTALNGFW